MAAVIKKVSKGFAQWFREFREKNRTLYKWYDHDLHGS
jgi:hypothetical protein